MKSDRAPGEISIEDSGDQRGARGQLLRAAEADMRNAVRKPGAGVGGRVLRAVVPRLQRAVEVPRGGKN